MVGVGFLFADHCSEVEGITHFFEWTPVHLLVQVYILSPLCRQALGTVAPSWWMSLEWYSLSLSLFLFFLFLLFVFSCVVLHSLGGKWWYLHQERHFTLGLCCVTIWPPAGIP